jgi:hypothetical protein
MRSSENKIKESGDLITSAARVLIGMVRSTETIEHGRSSGATLSLEVDLTGGGRETWKITIERTASSH